MQARDAAGRQVSLLNDDSSQADKAQQYHMSFPFTSCPALRPSLCPQHPPRSGSSSPNTPELLRSDSYDSQFSNDPISPLTPSLDFGYARGPVYIGHDYGLDAPPPAKRPAYLGCSRSSSYEEDSSGTSSVLERPSKRYPCRYRESHGCEKTFTTSGHASRHSKIHTAEKAVQCTYPGCHKKFTRADNMKQHLETHYKDKSRSSSGQRASKSALMDARRSSTSSSRSRSSTMGRDPAAYWESPEHHQKQYPLPTPPLPLLSGTAGTAWDMRGLTLPLLKRHAVVSSRPNNGLDALAMAIACQEGGRA